MKKLIVALGMGLSLAVSPALHAKQCDTAKTNANKHVQSFLTDIQVMEHKVGDITVREYIGKANNNNLVRTHYSFSPSGRKQCAVAARFDEYLNVNACRDTLYGLPMNPNWEEAPRQFTNNTATTLLQLKNSDKHVRMLITSLPLGCITTVTKLYEE